LPNIILTEQLSKIVYFEDLRAEDLQVLAQSSMTRTFEAGQTLFYEGDAAMGLWIVENGRIKISKLNAEGTEHILHILGIGDTFNDIAALGAGHNPANAVALRNATAHVIPSSVIVQLIETNGQFALKVVQVLAHRVRSLVGQIENLALYSVAVRLARFLIKQSEEPNLSGAGVTRTVIAAHLATTPQTISVALREIEATHAIKFDRHQIIILDEEKLRTIAML
jgi:CRP-like cAMP-binding protein